MRGAIRRPTGDERAELERQVAANSASSNSNQKLLAPEASEPLSFSLPSTPRIPPGRPKMEIVYDLGDLFFWIFRVLKTPSNFDIEKSLKQIRKSWFWNSQNPPQTLPKSIQNRRSSKSLIVYAIVAQTFDILKRRNLENIIVPWENQYFSPFREKHVLQFLRICPSKMHPKTIPKRGPND